MRVSPWLISFLVFTIVAQHVAQAQPSSAGLGPDNKIIRLRRPDGTPCLAFQPSSTSDAIINQNFHHYVFIENKCQRTISVTICYKTDDNTCQHLTVGGYSTEETMLGTMAGQPDFEFDYREHY